MNINIFIKLKSLLEEHELTGRSIRLDDYHLKCGNKVISPKDFELTTDEESMLDLIYNADSLGFKEEIGAVLEQKVNLISQMVFFTKLCIFESLALHEEDYSFPYYEYVTYLNTGSYDKNQKMVKDLVNIYGSSQLKENPLFNEAMTEISKVEFVCNSSKKQNILVKANQKSKAKK